MRGTSPPAYLSSMDRALRAVLAGLSAAAILAFIGLVGLRLGHPFGLDPAEPIWMETAARIAQGLPAYAAPSLDHVPLPGLPLYPAAAAGLVGMLGVHFWVGRLISALATLITSWLVLRMVRLETDSLPLGLSAAGVFLGAFAATGTLFDVGRPEPLAWLLCFTGLALLRTTFGVWGAVASALMIAGGCFTVHVAGWLALAAIVHLGLNDRERLPAFALVLAAAVASGAMWVRQTNPWFPFYAWDLAWHGMRFEPSILSRVLGAGVLGALGPLAVSVLLGIALPTPTWRGKSGVWFWAVVGSLVAVAWGTAQPAAVSPGIGPMLVALAIAGPCALMRVVNHLAAWPGSERAGRSWVLQGVLILQFLPLAHGLRAMVPDPAAQRAHTTLIERLRGLPEPVRVPGFAIAARESGHRPSLHPLALETLLAARGNRLVAKDPSFVHRLLAPLERGADRPTLVSERPLLGLGSENQAAWGRVASGYDAAMEWHELAGTAAPRFVQKPRALSVFPASAEPLAAGATIAEAVETVRDTTTAP